MGLKQMLKIREPSISEQKKKMLLGDERLARKIQALDSLKG
jgi:hypothetical protein